MDSIKYTSYLYEKNKQKKKTKKIVIMDSWILRSLSRLDD